ncbi:Plastocyanin protein [Marine Group I thaumarchaeote SCGC AAA799-P11]|uniref:Plastocyanin protein n=1 Tax=Marine Group I thaumarchaeote SCGC AAA799-P11 TaxID=1502295 RepID=A0A087RZN1_9ARCH|nr:Plastocyanin protein [Marine Group I thaumarchaeote SCGC AAA799-P11]
MKGVKLEILLLFGISLLVVSSFGTVYAQSSYTIKIPTGASDPNAPYFWQSEKDGSTTGTIEILRGDTVVWSNADTAPHTVTSGTPETGPDEMFDSGLFDPGEFFVLEFENVGSFPYFCIIHPWMVGEVKVTEGFSILPDVGKTVTDGDKSFDVEYKFSRLLSNPQINVDQKSITFELVGNSKSSNHDLVLKLSSELLDGPYVIWADGKKLSDFQHEKENGMNTLVIPLTEQSKTLTIVGTFVIPEFGTVAIMILSVAIISVIMFTAKSKLNLRV